jgi:hypothetical protein
MARRPIDWRNAQIRTFGDADAHLLVPWHYPTEDLQPSIRPRRTIYGSAPESYRLTPTADFVEMPIPKADWQAVIEQCHAEQRMPIYHTDASGVVWPWNQKSLGYCWNYSLAAAMMSCREAEGQTRLRLSPTSLGWLVHWRNQGYYLDGAIEGANQRGLPTIEYCPEQCLDPRQFAPKWEANGLLHRPLDWWDVDCGSGVERLIGTCLAILKTGRACYCALNWWSHAVPLVAQRWNPAVANSIEWIYWNSHGDGPIALTGSKGPPDEAYGVRSTTMSAV